MSVAGSIADAIVTDTERAELVRQLSAPPYSWPQAALRGMTLDQLRAMREASPPLFSDFLRWFASREMKR